MIRPSNVNKIKYYTIWALMLKIKVKHTNLLDFVSSSLFCLENDKLKLVLTQKFFWQVYAHFGLAVKKVKTERVDQINAQFCARVWGSRV